MEKCCVVLLALLAAVAAEKAPTLYPDGAKGPAAVYSSVAKAAPEIIDTPASYVYNYGVADTHTGASYKAGEQRDGQATAGSYSVALPDGRIQTVTYRVTADSGFVADVQVHMASSLKPRAPGSPGRCGR